MRAPGPAINRNVRAELGRPASTSAPTVGTNYALTNANEYWAEGAQWWFFSNYGECFAGNIKVESPDDLKAYDPVLFALLGRVFDTYRIPMDVYHGRKVRAVACPPAGR